MSELIDARNHGNFRWHLLATVSAMSLAVAISAKAEETGKPLVWIELGGQLERITGREDPFLPPVTLQVPTPQPFFPISPTEAQKPSIYSYGFEGKVSLRPRSSQWSFTAAVRYGRSSNNKHIHQQSNVSTRYPNGNYPKRQPNPFNTLSEAQFADFKVKNHESHMVVDFMAGRDVGIGSISSTANFGVRIASFSSKSQTSMTARPHVDFYVWHGGRFYFATPLFTDYTATATNNRSFRGIGPALSWSGDVPIVGNEDGSITADWGIDGALLFGRQKASGSHATSAFFRSGLFSNPSTVYDNPPLQHDRARSVIVPNVGFLAGLSFRYPGTKISFGYRADMFFGAMDMGIDQRDIKDRVFHGPYATISLGLGG